MNKNEKIKEEISKLLNSKSPNYEKLLDLTIELSKNDKENVRFSVDAGLINRLGWELVARQETAVSELVKNTYDADASKTKIYFINTNKAGGKLIVEDNGHGMTRDQLINGFMRISSTDKVKNPVSPGYKRLRAGRKGIGRFSTQRLGKKLTIITQTNKANKALKVEVDWDKFEASKELLTISSQIKEVKKERPHGTILIIDNLRETWTEAQIKRVYRFVMDLIQPFPLSKKNRKHLKDPGFKAFCYKDNKVIANTDIMFFKYSSAIIEGTVNGLGQGFYSVDSDKYKLNIKKVKIGKEKDNPSSKFEQLSDVYFKAYYFVYNVGEIPPQQETIIKENANKYGGIRLYRNGFRVLPYGEPFDDWLKLDDSIRRRSFLPVHGNINFFGFVEILDTEGKKFEETSSREGLIQNEALNELQNFVYRALVAGVTKVAEVRGIKITSGQKDWKKEQGESLTDIKNSISELSETINNILSKNKLEFNERERFQKIREVSDKVEFLNKAIDDQIKYSKDSLDEFEMMRVLAGLGLTIGMFIHEVKHYFSSMEADAQLLYEMTEAAKKKIAKRLLGNMDSFKMYSSYFDSAISENVNRDLRPLNVKSIIYNFVEAITPDLQRFGIRQPELSFEKYDIISCPMHPSEWASILFNFYTNSKKAILRYNSKPGRIRIKSGLDNNKVYIEFSDNGDGIPTKHKDQIFNAFFTTSAPVGHFSKKEDEIIGSGLGLKIVKDTVEAYDGKIFLISNPKNFTTTFRIELPKATEEEIENHEI